ncbi:MAG: PDZ domain-containing protein [Planctomycetia bacterium]|nr:PDZ domain-containing protein [Planctomycetia bacterium]
MSQPPATTPRRGLGFTPRFVALVIMMLLTAPGATTAQLLADVPSGSLADVPADLRDGETRSVAAAARLLAATVGLGSGTADMLEEGVASGVIVSPDGLILTVAHAMEGFDGEFAVLLADGRVTRARRLGQDAATDAGMLQITEPGPWPHLELGDSTRMRIGDWCLAAGHSDGIVQDRGPPVRLGRLRGVLRDESFQRLGLLTDCTLQPGDSGGPLVDLDGRLIGIGTSISTNLRDNYSVPIEVYRRLWDGLRAGTTTSGRAAEPAMQSDFRDASLSHRAVRDRFAASAAPAVPAVAEILADDDERVALGVVVREDGIILTKHSELTAPIRCRVAGEIHTARLVAADDALDIALLAVDATNLVPIRWATAEPVPGRWLVTPGPGARPLAVGVVSVASRPIPPRPRYVGDDDHTTPALGVTLDGESAASGTRLRRVNPGGPARAAGLRRGDRIVALDGLPVASTDDLAARLRAARIGDLVTIAYQRDGLYRETEATLASRADAQSDKPRRRDLAFSGPVSRRRQDFPRAFTHDTVLPADACGGVVVGLDGRALGLSIARSDRTTTYAIPAAVIHTALARLLPEER